MVRAVVVGAVVDDEMVQVWTRALCVLWATVADQSSSVDLAAAAASSSFGAFAGANAASTIEVAPEIANDFANEYFSFAGAVVGAAPVVDNVAFGSADPVPIVADSCIDRPYETTGSPLSFVAVAVAQSAVDVYCRLVVEAAVVVASSERPQVAPVRGPLYFLLLKKSYFKINITLLNSHF